MDRLLRDEIIPYDFCKFMNEMEANLLFNYDHFVPDFGDLYNCCDWCDHSWTRSNSQFLYDEATKLIAAKTEQV